MSPVRVPFGELVGQSGKPTEGFTLLRGPELLPECRGFPRFSRGFAFRILISEKVSRGRSGPATLHPIPGRLPDSLFGEREPTQELTLRAETEAVAAFVSAWKAGDQSRAVNAGSTASNQRNGEPGE